MISIMSNKEFVTLLRNVAAVYTIKDEKKHRFQIIAYQKAADSIEHLNTELSDLIYEKIEKIPGVGPGIMSYIQEYVKKGSVKHFNEITKNIPPAIFPLLDVPSFGPKKAYKIVANFNLKNPATVVDDVKRLGKEGKIAALESFGEKSQADILRAINEYKLGKTKSNRMVLPYAFELAQRLIKYLKTSKDVVEAYPLGSLRRKVVTVGDIDIATSTNSPQAVLSHFINYPQKERIIEKGERTASILLNGGRQIDLMVQEPNSFGALLQHFTGSKDHNIALREYALKKSFSLSEYGIKILKEKGTPLKRIKTEEQFYKFLGLEFIPPEIRENNGEIQLAEKHMLPKLVEKNDIKGDLHIHSNYPIEPSHDLGQNSFEEMIDEAGRLGYEYIGFSEHNPSVSKHSMNQIYKILSNRNHTIEQLNKSNKNIRVINLLEVDILASGELALDDKSLSLIDAAIVSIHSVFNMDKSKMTERILKGFSHPKAKILAHPTGRILNERAGVDADWNRIFDFAKKNNKALEINAWPTRLDLPDVLVKQAKDSGNKFVINTDSHEVSQMSNMLYGVSVARRGWCTKNEILNTLSYSKFYSWLKS